ncbi:MAG: hypothetical protein ACFCVH_09880 [Alphaproteobacteria bacterium]
MARCSRFLSLPLALLCGIAASGASAEQEIGEPLSSVSLVGAWMTDNNWKEIAVLDNVGFRDAYLVGGMLSHELIGSESWAIEAEGHVIRHFGKNDHWEFNAVLVGRWRAFPWDEWVPTSLALGVGPSLATEVPNEEAARSGDSAEFMLYWMAEVEAGPADTPWSGFARLHHRSSGYGVFAERGGSNWLMLGARYRF